jgi:metallopeptidase MepB
MAASAETFRESPQAPLLWTDTPSKILAGAKCIIEHSRNNLDQIIRTVQPSTATYANVLEPLAQDENDIYSQKCKLGFYQDVFPDASVREASGEAKKLLRDYLLEIRMREDLYQLVDAVKNKNEDLDPEDYFFLQNQHGSYARNGLKLPAGPERDRYREIRQRLNQLSTDFKTSDREALDTVWLFPHELEGLSEDTISGLRKGTGENEGKRGVRTDLIASAPIFKSCTVSETRRRVFVAHENRAIQNVPLFKETMVLRDEAARMLGYPDHATFRLATKMAKNPETVNRFLADLKSRLLPAGKAEFELMEQLKKEELLSKGEEYDPRCYLWDPTYYKDILLRTKYSVDRAKIAEYFPLQTTIYGMLRLFQHLFGMAFVEVIGVERDKLAPSGNGNELVWQEDVQVFNVWDDEEEGGGFLGYLYIDHFSREGKRGGVSSSDLQPVYIPNPVSMTE